MKRLITVCIACAMAVGLFAATSAMATDDGVQLEPANVAAKFCASEKKADKAAFKATYGEHAMRECIRANRDEAADAINNAAQECDAERTADPETFATTYGSNDNARNAYGKCVSSKVKASKEEATEEFTNAAQECRAERTADADTFAATYGTNTNHRNALGKCVSQKVHESEETPTA